MNRRLPQLLFALIVAFASALPVGVRAMPTSSGMGGTGIEQHCLTCKPQRGGSVPDKMPACQVSACAAVATLPRSALLPGRLPLQAAYMTVPPVRWNALASPPDPFPPRPIALV